jgi:hypothetical protein
MTSAQLSVIDVEYKERVEIYPGFIINAYRPVSDIDRSIYGEFLVAPKSISESVLYEEGWLGAVLAAGRKDKGRLKVLQELGFGDWQIEVKVVNHPTHRTAKPIQLQALPIVFRYVSIYGETVEKRLHATSLLMTGTLEYLKHRLRKAWGVTVAEEQEKEEFAKTYSRYKAIVEALAVDYPLVANGWINQQEVGLKVSSPLGSYYYAVKGITRKLKKRYPNGVIKNKTLIDVRNNIALLSTFIPDWQKISRKELRVRLGCKDIGKYPDLSFLIPVVVDGRQESCLFMLEFCDNFVGHQFVEKMLGRRYLQSAKDTLGAKYVFQMFVSPLGATPLARDYIQQLLMTEEKGRVGILTVKELVETLRRQALSAVRQANIRGEINSICERLAYNLPTDQNEFLFSPDCSQPAPEPDSDYIQLPLF